MTTYLRALTHLIGLLLISVNGTSIRILSQKTRSILIHGGRRRTLAITSVLRSRFLSSPFPLRKLRERSAGLISRVNLQKQGKLST